MIVRSWHGIVPCEQAKAFEAHLLRTGVAEAEATPGNCGAYIHHQSREPWEHFFMVSYWRDFEAIRTFAGSQPQIAVCYPEDQKFGLISDPIVLHHEVATIPAEFPLERIP